MYGTVAVVVDTAHSCPSLDKKTGRFLIVLLHFWLLGLQHVNFLHFMDFSRANCVQAMVLLHI